MAYTLPCFEIDGVAQKAAAYLVDPATPGDTAPLLNPVANIGRVMWHSDLKYYSVEQDATATLSLPARAYNAGATGYENFWWAGYQVSAIKADVTPFSPLSLAALPFVALLRDNKWDTGLIEIDTHMQAGWLNPQFRWLRITGALTGVKIEDMWANVQYTWPAQSSTVRGLAFAHREPVAGGDFMDANAAAGYFKIGRAVIDTTRAGFLRQVSSGGIPFTVDRTIDLSSGGMRRWNPDGTTTTLAGTYAGSYAGPTWRQFVT